MTKKHQNSNSDGTLKRGHTEVAEASSSDEDSMNDSILKKTRVVSDSWPRFLIIESPNDGALKALSPFAIQKALVGLAGEPKTVKKLKNGSLLVECLTESHSTCLLKSTIFCNIPINVSPHSSLNSSKGVIRSRDLEGVSEDEMVENLSSQGVTSVKRIQIRRNNEFIPTNTLILTFNKPLLPQSVKAGYLSIPVEPYIPNPLRCFKCQKFGHGQTTCRNKLTCARCGQFDHDSKTCKNDIICINCKGNHFAYSRECAQWKIEKRVQQVKVEKHLSFPEARKLVETANPVAAGKSFAAAVKVSTRSVATNTDLTWRFDEAKYKKLSDVEKGLKQAEKASQKQKEALRKHSETTKSTKMTQSSQVSLDSQNPSTSSSGVLGPSVAKSGKDTKMHTKMSMDSQNPSSSLSGSSTGLPSSSTHQPVKDKVKKKDTHSGRVKKVELHPTMTRNYFNVLASGVADGMDVSYQDIPPIHQPQPKLKIIPVLPPDGE